MVLFLPALFAEANRTRALTVGILRALTPSHRCVLPDLPGTLESERALTGTDWDEWSEFAGYVADHFGAERVVALRGGSLLPAGACPRLHIAPTTGARLLRDLVRARLTADREEGQGGTAAALQARMRDGTERLAGFDLPPGITGPLAAAEPIAEAFTVRLSSDGAVADATVPGPPLWRRAEPGRDEALSMALAEQVRAWAA